MMKNPKLIAVVIVLFVIGYEGYSKVTAPPPPKLHIKGDIYILPKQFLVNLQDGRYGQVGVALELAPGQSTSAGAAAAATPPPDGFGTLPEEAAIRDIVTNTLTNSTSDSLTTTDGRVVLKAEILKAITTTTDVKVTGILLTDIAVQ